MAPLEPPGYAYACMSSIRKQKGNLYVLEIVLGANKDKLPKGNRKDSGKQKCASERTLA